MMALRLVLVALLLFAGTAQAGVPHVQTFIATGGLVVFYEGAFCSAPDGAPCYQYEVSAQGCLQGCVIAGSSGHVSPKATPDEIGVGTVCFHVSPPQASTNPCASDAVAQLLDML